MVSLNLRESNSDPNTDMKMNQPIRVLLAGKAAPLAEALREAQRTPGYVVVGVLSEDAWYGAAGEAPWLGEVARVEEAMCRSGQS